MIIVDKEIGIGVIKVELAVLDGPNHYRTEWLGRQIEHKETLVKVEAVKDPGSSTKQYVLVTFERLYHNPSFLDQFQMITDGENWWHVVDGITIGRPMLDVPAKFYPKADYPMDDTRPVELAKRAIAMEIE